MAEILEIDGSSVLGFSFNYDETSFWGRMKFTSEAADRIAKDRRFRLTLSYMKNMDRIMYSAIPCGDDAFLVRSI